MSDTPSDILGQPDRGAASHLVRSFDLFDTLVTRRCVFPRAIFDFIEVRSGCSGFASARLAAEATLYARGDYRLSDIYAELNGRYGLSKESAEILLNYELTVEFANLFRIEENCALVRPGDLIISDMYLPQQFVRRVIDEVCNLPFSPLFLSAKGKRSGAVWSALRPRVTIAEHVGDDSSTDVASPLAAGIPARQTTIARRTPKEGFLADCGLAPLANAIREARLATWHPSPVVREVQLLQIEANFPLLFVASLHLLRLAGEHGWECALFSSRDCFLWLTLYTKLAAATPGAPRGQYFYTSRVAKATPSPDYLAYFDDLRAGRRTVVVDACGTGWSTSRLIQHSPVPATDLFVIQRINDPNWRKRYEQVGKVTAAVPFHALVERGDNTCLELLNCALHPMVLDVLRVANSYVPAFSGIGYDARLVEVIGQHHTAFRAALAAASHITPAELQEMVARWAPELAPEIYGWMAGTAGPLAEIREHQKAEEVQVWDLLEKRREPDL